MEIHDRVQKRHEEMTGWRRELHSRPELAFQEKWTSDFVAEKLESFGLPIHRGLAGTGVVATLKNGEGPSIGLRADMDALPLLEKNQFGHRSQNEGKMHACGHDGHTTMLLGAASVLAESPSFQGTVHFIFQPAEEGGGGGNVMVKEGLFEKFPVDAVYGMHNWPGMEPGEIGVHNGPVLAANDAFDLEIQGKGGHAAMPDLCIDSILAASQVVSALQSVVSRGINPVDSAVVTVTQIHAGDAYNVIPDSVKLCGSIRTFKKEVREKVISSMESVVKGVASGLGASAELMIKQGYPATINTAQEAQKAASAAARVVGETKVILDADPSTGSEDFAYMLQARPGCYIWLGNGNRDGGCMLHNPHYDFNDEILPIGTSYWVSLVEQELPIS